MTTAYRLPKSGAGFGNRLLNLVDALGQVAGSQAEITTTDRELLRVYKEPVTRHAQRFPAPLLLSETLFRRPEIDLSRHLRMAPAGEISQRTVAIHFRGGDFTLWKSHSVISAEFFISNLAQLEDTVRIHLFTDDHNHATVKGIMRFAELTGRTIYVFHGCLYSDFSLLCRVNRIIASPSTFSLCAALLGGRNITFPTSYAEREALDGAEFWARLVSGERPHYVEVSLT